tara:strand:+ start:671 stop:1006 length:336 start_codon:yes stop_codon:yes gene_type:complete
MNNRYKELDDTLKTNIDSLINTLASCQNKTQNDEIFNEIIKDSIKEITTNHQCYLRYKEIETNKINKEIDRVNQNMIRVIKDNKYSYSYKRVLMDGMFKRIDEYKKEIELL